MGQDKAILRIKVEDDGGPPDVFGDGNSFGRSLLEAARAMARGERPGGSFGGPSTYGMLPAGYVPPAANRFSLFNGPMPAGYGLAPGQAGAEPLMSIPWKEGIFPARRRNGERDWSSYGSGEEASSTKLGQSIAAAFKERIGGVFSGIANHAGEYGAASLSSVGTSGAMLGAAWKGAEKLGETIPALGKAMEGLKTVVGAVTAVEKQRIREVQHFADAMGSVVRNDFFGARLKQLDKQVEDRNRFYGGTLGGLANWWMGDERKAAGIRSYLSLRQSSAEEAGRLGMYSPQIAYAQGQARLTAMRADMSSAGAHGGSLARLVKTQAEFDAAMQKAMAPVKEGIFKQLDAMMARGEFDAKLFEKMEAMSDHTKFLELLKGDTEASRKLQEQMRKELEKIRKQGEKDDAGEDMVKELLDGIGLLENGGAMPDPAGWAAQVAIRPLE